MKQKKKVNESERKWKETVNESEWMWKAEVNEGDLQQWMKVKESKGGGSFFYFLSRERKCEPARQPMTVHHRTWPLHTVLNPNSWGTSNWALPIEPYSLNLSKKPYSLSLKETFWTWVRTCSRPLSRATGAVAMALDSARQWPCATWPWLLA